MGYDWIRATGGNYLQNDGSEMYTVGKDFALDDISISRQVDGTWVESWFGAPYTGDTCELETLRCGYIANLDNLEDDWYYSI